MHKPYELRERPANLIFHNPEGVSFAGTPVDTRVDIGRTNLGNYRFVITRGETSIEFEISPEQAKALTRYLRSL